MNPRLLAPPLLLIITASIAPTQQTDTIRLKDGRQLHAQILKIENQHLIVSRQLDFGTSTERHPLQSIALVSFASSAKASHILLLQDTPDKISLLADFWQQNSQFLPIQASPAGQVGIALAKSLARKSDPTSLSQALKILSTIESNDWSNNRRSEAFAEKLLVLETTGQGQDARAAAEAALLTSSRTSNHGLRAAASLALARLLRLDLANLEKQNPRWQLDPIIRPERQRLYHRIIELLLIPYLENGATTEPAARSLIELVEFHLATGSQQEAISVAQDIVEIYPSSTQAPIAKKLLSSPQNQPWSTSTLGQPTNTPPPTSKSLPHPP